MDRTCTARWGAFINEAGKLGYIDKDNQNLLMAGIVPLKGGAPAVQEEELRRVISEKLVDLHVDGNIVVSKESGEMMAQAEKTGLSVNKYMVYDRTQKNGLNISVDVSRDNSVRQILDEANVPLKKIFPNECVEVRRANQRPSDNGGAASMENGMSRGKVDELQQHRSGTGYIGGEEHSGPAHDMGGYSAGPATSSSGSMMPGYAGQEIPGQPNGIPENHTGEM